jgi:hypothetical protein
MDVAPPGRTRDDLVVNENRKRAEFDHSLVCGAFAYRFVWEVIVLLSGIEIDFALCRESETDFVFLMFLERLVGVEWGFQMLRTGYRSRSRWEQSSEGLAQEWAPSRQTIRSSPFFFIRNMFVFPRDEKRGRKKGKRELTGHMTKRKASIANQATNKRQPANRSSQRPPPGQKKVRFRQRVQAHPSASSKARSKQADDDDDDENGNEGDEVIIPEQEAKEAEENSGESDQESKTEIKQVAKKAKPVIEELSTESDDSDSEATSSTSGSETDNEVDESEAVEVASADTETEGKTSSSALVTKKPKLSAATLKTKMSPSGLQNPISRRKIWKHLTLMMERSGYRAVAHAKPPTDEEEILPNNRNVLGQFHLHFIDANALEKSDDSKSEATGGSASEHEPKKIREPVYVLFASKAGEPTLKSLTFHSRHLILITDSLTGRAKTVLQSLPVRAPPLVVKVDMDAEIKELPKPPVLTLNDVFVEAFVSKDFMFDLPRQRYLNVMQFSRTPLSEVQQVCTIYGTRKRATKAEAGDVPLTASDVENFPKMFESDPVARYYRLAPSDILRVDRLSSSAGRHLAHRVIVPAPRL